MELIAPLKMDDKFPCADCGWIGCVVWMKYVRKTPPVTDEEHEQNKKIIKMMHDVLSQTGCKYRIPKKR